jgi:hypothetical protein
MVAICGTRGATRFTVANIASFGAGGTAASFTCPRTGENAIASRSALKRSGAVSDDNDAEAAAANCAPSSAGNG